MLPERCSSAINRIESAGTNKVKMNGANSKNGRSVVRPITKYGCSTKR